MIALDDGGIAKEVIMLLAVLASNLVLENFVEPKIMGTSTSTQAAEKSEPTVKQMLR